MSEEEALLDLIEKNRITLGTLDALGIAKGEPFKPDARMQEILIEADKRSQLCASSVCSCMR